MKLIPNWKKCIRLYSQQAFLVATALQSGWLLLDGHQKASIPDHWVTILTIVILVLGAIGRLVPQPVIGE